MKGKSICEACGKEFEWCRYENQTIARFCCKKCWYDWNSKNLSSFNDDRFKWENASEEEKLERLKKNFFDKVIVKDGCWDWKGVTDKNGYGLMPSGKSKQSRACRISWRIHNGEIPPKIIVCHKCDNPKCCNPEHLFLGTPKDNSQDMAKKLRSTVGSKNKNSKLKEEDIPKIRKLIEIGVTNTRIAKDFGVSRDIISCIKRNITWRHVE